MNAATKDNRVFSIPPCKMADKRVPPDKGVPCRASQFWDVAKLDK